MLVAVKNAGVEEHQKQQQQEMKPLQVGENVESDRERREKNEGGREKSGRSVIS